MTKQVYNIRGKDIEMDYTFLIHDFKKYVGIKEFLTYHPLREKLIKLNDRHDLQFYSTIEGKGFLFFDDRNDIDVELSFTKNFDKEIKKNLIKILK